MGFTVRWADHSRERVRGLHMRFALKGSVLEAGVPAEQCLDLGLGGRNWTTRILASALHQPLRIQNLMVPLRSGPEQDMGPKKVS